MVDVAEGLREGVEAGGGSEVGVGCYHLMRIPTQKHHGII